MNKSTNESTINNTEEYTLRVQDEESKDDTESKTNDKPKTRKSRKSRKQTKKDDKKTDEEANTVDKKSKKSVKKREKAPKRVKKIVKKKEVKLPPILESEYKERMNYLTKRLYHCKDDSKRQAYQNHIDKINKREKISC